MSKLDRFSHLLGADFSVCLQLSLPGNLSKQQRELIETEEREGRATINIQKADIVKRTPERRQLFVLSQAASGETLERSIERKYSKVLFDGALCSIAKECHLVFRRKFDRETNLSWLWLMAGRHGEKACFNAFSSPNPSSGNPNFVTLLFSSKTKPTFSGFKPLYIKVRVEGEYHYFEIEAHASSNGELRDLLVEARGVSEEESPEPLRTAIASS